MAMSTLTWVDRLVSVLSASSPPPEHDDYWLPCRETEGRTIHQFLRSCLSVNNGSVSGCNSNSSKSSKSSGTQQKKRALYIAGKPGTGKTASVNRIMARLAIDMSQPGVSSGSNPTHHSYRVVNVNAASLLGSSKSNIFMEIARQMKMNTTETKFDPVQELERVFLPKRKPSRRTKMTIIVIDEIDSSLSLTTAIAGQGLHYHTEFPSSLSQLPFELDVQPDAAALLPLATRNFKLGLGIEPEALTPVYLRDNVTY
jgi:hypothetical protein